MQVRLTELVSINSFHSTLKRSTQNITTIIIFSVIFKKDEKHSHTVFSWEGSLVHIIIHNIQYTLNFVCV